MTGNDTASKLRAVFLTVLMVGSVLGATVAFSGAAVAAGNTAGAVANEVTPGQSQTLGQGESGDVQELKIEDTLGSNGNQIYIDTITLHPETGGSYLEADDIDQIQLVVEGSTVATADSITSNDYTSDGITIDDFTSSNNGFSNGDKGGDGDSELYTNSDGASGTINVKVTLSSSADGSDGGDFEIASTDITLLDASQLSGSGGAELFDGGSGNPTTTTSVTETDTLSLQGAAGSSLDTLSIDSVTDPVDRGSTETVGYSLSDTDGIQSGTLSIKNPDGDVVKSVSVSSGGSHEFTIPTGSTPGTWTAILQATDNNGNADSDSKAFVVSNDGPTIENFSPTSSTTVTDTQTVVTVDISDDDGVDSSSVSVDISDSSTTLLSGAGTSTDGIDWDGSTLTINPAGSGVPDFSQGSNTVSVSADDNLGASNSNSVTFKVDTKGPTFSNFNPADESTTTDNQHKVSVDIDDKTGVNPDTISITINGNTYSPRDDDDVVTWAQGTLEVDPSVSGITDFEQGTVDVTVSAKDPKGNSNSASWSFSVDSTKPKVNEVDVSNAPINDSESGNTQLVTVTFSEKMDTGSVPQIELRSPDDEDQYATDVADLKEGVGNNGFGQNDGFASDAQTWTGTIDLSDIPADVDGDVQVVVSNAQDPAGNGLASDSDSGTVAVDTQVPSIKTSAPGSAISGSVDVSSYFTVENTGSDDLSESYWYSTDDGTTWEAVDSPTEFDTTTVDDTENLDFKLNLTDDVNNYAEGTVTDVAVDNVKPTLDVSYESGKVVSGSVGVTDAFDITGVTDQDSVTYEYSTNGGSDWTTESPTGGEDPLDASLDTSSLDDGAVTLKATVNPGHGDSMTKTVDVYVDNLNELGTSVTQTENGAAKVTIDAEPGSQLENVEVAFVADDGYDDTNITVTDFTETQDVFGDYHYTATVGSDDLRDGSYDVVLVSASDNNGRVVADDNGDNTYGVQDIDADSEQEGVQPVIVDQSTPEVTNAYLAGDNAGTDVIVTFDEPVSSVDDQSKISIEGGRADLTEGSASVVEASGGKKVEFTLDSVIQTGDAPNVTFAEGAVSDLDDSDNEDSWTSIHTMKLELDEGTNLVSVPAQQGAEGGLSTTALNEEGTLNNVWSYDEMNNSWSNYDPTLDDEPKMLEGGQGYLVNVSSDTTLYLNVQNQPTSVPQEATFDSGWALVGHYQPASQNAKDALTSIGSSNYGTVYAESSDSAYQLSGVNVADDGESFKPGEAYWVWIDSDGDVHYKATDYAA